MARPGCAEHPHAKVWRDGYYGLHKEFIRWKCKPADGSAAHFIRHNQFAQVGLHSKLTGGPESGCCDECEREWHEDDGMPSAMRDNFVLREKARALVRIAQGGSFRAAGYGARVRVMVQRDLDPPARAASRDWRMAGDWASQYADIIADELLPTAWPKAIAVDSFDVRIKAYRPNGTPIQKGRLLYTVIGAVGYDEFGRAGKLWHLRAFTREREREFREFFSDLTGRRGVETVVCDGSSAIRNAATWAFPHATVYPCSWHLGNILADHARLGRLNTSKRAIWRALRVEQGDLFRDRVKWNELCRMLDRYLSAMGPNTDPRIERALRAMETWRARNGALVAVALGAPHWPRDLKLLEEHLASVRDRLGERRRSFRNLPRLNCLLRLMLLDLRDQAEETKWAHILRENHNSHHGTPPPRRVVDGQLIKV